MLLLATVYPQLAQAFGYLSIGCWLCAQLPQVFKNARQRNCEGLSLPFLVNWLSGDVTNLIGCILTDQLAFQASLSPPPVTTSSSPYTSMVLSPPTHRRMLSHPPLYASSSKTAMADGQHPSYHVSSESPRLNTHVLPETSYSAIYEAALDVARTAERAAHRRENSRQRLLARSRRNTSNSQPTVEEVAPEEEDVGRMRSSWRSERSAASSVPHSEDEDEDGPRRMTMSTGTLLVRGRARGRERAPGVGGSGIRALSVIPAEELGVDPTAEPGAGAGETALIMETRKVKSQSPNLARRTQSSRNGKARAAAGMAFMSLGLVARFSGSDGAGEWTSGIQAYTGSVVASPANTPANLADTALRIHSSPIIISPPLLGSVVTLHLSSTSGPKHPSSPDYQRIIGRISAWACTTLYLTSRLPQIWKNFTRRSVEGLSILLFLFAFLGNLLYVASILLNPGGTTRRETQHYLLEALPYLLGSGGTLLFDLTIMGQSYFYGSAPPVPEGHGHLARPRMRRSTSRPAYGRRISKYAEEVGSEHSPLLRGGRTPSHPSPNMADLHSPV